ncbi:RNA polymerase sigma factor [Parapedobacter koreensis]|uniref:RNA polymerase sigma-70 factor, ECF subfamily n=1 Tax=Parapedobacter koreensis TaxID=332977 RepID=A0A1H7FTG4_9SPHI|nr:sigma-70 family RNA polymerase sigma factor [Parapedobacter koreensis]SEK28507.1 RNA polymerase sigma-70 factor, ECF subfamily [Parapedobacter koreensis]
MEAIDTLLIGRLRQGDAHAYTVLFERYWKFLYAVAYRRLQDEELAQDIVQEVFMQVWDKREKLTLTPAYIEYYLLKAVKNRIINHYTSQRVKAEVLERVMHRMETVVAESAYQPSRYLELERFLDEQVELLPDTMRAVFLMRSDNLSIQEIAKKMHIAEQTVKNNLTEASHRLRRSLLKKFSDEEFAGLVIIVTILTNN